MTMAIVLFSFIISLGGCSNPLDKEVTVPVNRLPSQLTSTEKQLVHSSNCFGFKLFCEIVKNEEPDSNIFISPLSAAYALSMTYNGANGATQEAMAQTLEVTGLPLENVNQGYRSLTTILLNADNSIDLGIANSIWYRPNEAVLPEFKSTCQIYYDAVIKEIEFSLPTAADSINGWVYDNTGGLIDKLIDPPISRGTVMYLINAIYFKGDWSYPFNPDHNFDTTFYSIDGKEYPCTMMSLDTTLYYFSNNDFQAIDLIYGDALYRMTLFLPNSGKSVDDIIKLLTAENWDKWTGSFAGRDVMLALPKFRFAYGIALNDALKALGMEIAFEPGLADFTNMIEGGGVWIDTVLHKSFIEVNEKGTEAAAITSVEMFRSCPTIILNRPFLFAVREKDSGAILFMGKIVNPVWCN